MQPVGSAFPCTDGLNWGCYWYGDIKDGLILSRAQRPWNRVRRGAPGRTRSATSDADQGALVVAVPNARFSGTPESALPVALEKLAHEHVVSRAAQLPPKPPWA